MTTRDDFLKKRREIIESEFSKLNPAQREAVLSPAGQTLILAGAGSGKTTVIVNRIACLIKYGDACYSPEVPFGGDPEDDLRLITDLAEGKEQPEHERFRAKQLMQHNAPPPWAVMAITFTNKAAQELKDRLAAMLGDAAGEIWASTFHSACAKILRRESSEGKTGYGPDFAIYDTDDTARTIKECYKALSVDEKTLPVKFTASRISRAKDRLIGPEEFESEIAGNDAMLRQVGRVYKEYRKRLRSSNAMDFDDIIFNTVELFDKDPDVLEKYRRRFKYILVDEYQDTNAAQFRLINLLAGEKGNLCVVGDDDQSIYKFRGATVENIINFDTQYPAAKVVRLEQNYRSTSNILAAANSVIKNNLSRRSKTLWTAKKGGEKLTEYCGGNERDEAQYIGAQILRGLGEGRKACDFAVLYRSNAQSNVIETTFSKMGIGYRVVGGHRFYDRAEIKDMLSYLCVINNPSDTLRLTRIINVPRRGIGASTVTAAARIAAAESISLFDVIRRAGKYGELSKAAGRLTAFAEMIEELRADSEKLSLSELYQEVLDRTGYLNMYLEENTPESADRAENLRELMSSVEAYEDENENASLRSFLEEAALMSDIDNYDSEEDAILPVVKPFDNRKAFTVPYHDFEYFATYIKSSGEIVHDKIFIVRSIACKSAYAVTFHKAQGLTLDAVYIDTRHGGSDSDSNVGESYIPYSGIYLGLSRCKTLEGVGLSDKITPDQVKVNEYAPLFFLPDRDRVVQSGDDDFLFKRMIVAKTVIRKRKKKTRLSDLLDSDV